MVITRPAKHPAPNWVLAGPWYRWTRPGLPEDGRASRPAIQKFAGDDFIQSFLESPQHSLKYDETIDVVNNYDLVSAAPGGSLAGKVGSLFAVNSQGKPAASGEAPFRARLAPSNLRKLYQPAHDRHYLVACELHCDAPGFPSVTRSKVCQAGFVVRRRRSIIPANITPEIFNAHNAPVRKAEADFLELKNLSDIVSDPGSSAALIAGTRTRQKQLASDAGVADWDALVALRTGELAKLRDDLDAWFKQNGISTAIDGWFPSVQDGRASRIYGAWQTLDAAEQIADISSGELSYPMFPLVPDPRETGHDAAGRTLYYGTIPTTGLEHDSDGIARFDDLTTYEVRCFVREHHTCPPKIGKTPDCNGPLAWSLPSEAFRFAAAFDVLGAANRPITIKMPDLRELAAQAATRPRGKLSPVRFVQPQQMTPKISGSTLKSGSMGEGAICSFSIPLITIVALFVLNIFLPIVVFIFNLWFLLVFRFCIPPSIKFAADVDAALAATPPGIDLDADFAVKVSGVDKLAGQLNTLLNSSMKTRIKEDTGADQKPDLSSYSNNALGPLDQSLQDAADLKADAQGILPPPPPVGTPLVYEAHVTPVWPKTGASA